MFLIQGHREEAVNDNWHFVRLTYEALSSTLILDPALLSLTRQSCNKSRNKKVSVNFFCPQILPTYKSYHLIYNSPSSYIGLFNCQHNCIHHPKPPLGNHSTGTFNVKLNLLFSSLSPSLLFSTTQFFFLNSYN